VVTAQLAHPTRVGDPQPPPSASPTPDDPNPRRIVPDQDAAEAGILGLSHNTPRFPLLSLSGQHGIRHCEHRSRTYQAPTRDLSPKPDNSAQADRAGCRAGAAARGDEERDARRYDHWVPECLFCGIASGEIPAKIVGESSRTIAFRDIDPQAPIHILVIPKQHHADVAAVVAAGGGLLEEMAAMAHSAAVAEGVGESGYRVVLNSGPDAGQDVPHIHAHVLGGRRLQWPPG